MNKFIFYEREINGMVDIKKIPENMVNFSDEAIFEAFLYDKDIPKGAKCQVVDFHASNVRLVGDAPHNPVFWQDYRKLWPHVFTDESYKIY